MIICQGFWIKYKWYFLSSISTKLQENLIVKLCKCIQTVRGIFMDNGKYWEGFTMTGKVSDYLTYREKEKQHEDRVKGKQIGDKQNGRQNNSIRDDIVNNSHW